MTSSMDNALRELVRYVVRDEMRIVVRELSEARPSPTVSPPVVRNLDAHEAAEVAGVSAASIRDWVRKGELRGCRASRLRRIKSSDLESYLERAAEAGEGVVEQDDDAVVAEILAAERTRCASRVCRGQDSDSVSGATARTARFLNREPRP